MDQRVIIKQTLSLYINLPTHFFSMNHLLEKANPLVATLSVKLGEDWRNGYINQKLGREIMK